MAKLREAVKSAVGWVRGAFAYLSAKKYTTLAGTMAFFLVMSVMPFLFWLTLLFGKLELDYSQLFELEIFAQVKDLLLYLQEAAKSATAGASVVLLATTLYSSTNLFYHMRRSGEIIYECRRRKGSIAIRLSALALIFIVMPLLVAGVGGVPHRERLPPTASFRPSWRSSPSMHCSAYSYSRFCSCSTSISAPIA